MASDEDEWFEPWLPDARGRPRKLRLYADHNVPVELVEAVRALRIPIATAADDGHAGHDDSAIYARARKLRRVLLTFDHHFWDDRKHSLHTGPGVVLLDMKAERIEAALRAFSLFHAIFAKAWSLEWWPGLKVRITSEAFTLKTTGYNGAIAEYAVRLAPNGHVLVRELREWPSPALAS